MHSSRSQTGGMESRARFPDDTEWRPSRNEEGGPYKRGRYDDRHHDRHEPEENPDYNAEIGQENPPVPKFLAFRLFATRDTTVSDMDTPDEAKLKYTQYKESFTKEYTDAIICQPSVYKSKAIQERYSLKAKVDYIKERKEHANGRLTHFQMVLSSGLLSDLCYEGKIFPMDVTEVDVDGNCVSNPPVVSEDHMFTVPLDGNATEDTPLVKSAMDSQMHSPLVHLPPYYPLDYTVNAIILRDIPNQLSRSYLLEKLKEIEVEGISDVYITLHNLPAIKQYCDNLGVSHRKDSDVVPQLRRDCTIQFLNDDHVKEAMRKLSQRSFSHDERQDAFEYTLRPVELAGSTEIRVRQLVTAFSHPETIRNDLILSAQLIRALDIRFGCKDAYGGENEESILENPIIEKTGALVDTMSNQTYKSACQQLDIQILYLRFVHGFDYYQNAYITDLRDLWALNAESKVDLMVRSPVDIDSPDAENVLNLSKQLHIDRLTAHEERIRAETVNAEEPIPEMITEETPEVQEKWARFIEDMVYVSDQGRARCGACEKLFKAADFVKKHLKNKHYVQLDRLIELVNFEHLKKAFKADPLGQYFVPPPMTVTNSGDGKIPGKILSSYNPSPPPPPGPVRRMKLPPREHNGASGYRDWDKPTIDMSKRTGQFRHMVAYDDL